MAFANEYLTDEAERKKYGNAHATLDREREAWLIRNGGGGERPWFVELHWQGEQIKMHAYETQTKTDDNHLIMEWYVAKMSIPERFGQKFFKWYVKHLFHLNVVVLLNTTI
jgi:hypothetical protein